MAASVNPTDSIHDREPVNILMVDDQPARLQQLASEDEEDAKP